MRRVILESPYAGKQINRVQSEMERRRNILYARLAIRDALARGDAPIASHLLYTQPNILNDQDVEERQWGIDAGLIWGSVAEATVVYEDFGISKGMEFGIAAALNVKRSVEYRKISEGAMNYLRDHHLHETLSQMW